MDYQTQQGPGQQGGGKKGLIIALVVGAVLVLSSILCCFGAVGFGLFSAVNVEKTYYAECQDALNGDQCGACCRARGHSGNAYGNIINDDDYVCGCF